ncbi:MAG TPA: DUF481 domain-containing protein [Vicinamibacterales bacterium]|nr:DUF481 domain-containing protein [Vicinamibacterales bacterium]
MRQGWICLAMILVAVPAAAQTTAAPPAVPPGWSGSAGFGLALNRGNTDTTNLNISGDTTYDPKTDHVWKFRGLYLRGETDGAVSVDRLEVQGRYQHDLAARAYAFGQLEFLEDEFKLIDSLWAPSAGIGYRIVDTAATKLSADAGLGVKREQDTGIPSRTSALVTAGDALEHKLSAAASITQHATALWTASDFGDAIYSIDAGVAAGLTARTQLKFQVQDTLATRPPSNAVKDNDVALLTTIVYKFP